MRRLYHMIASGHVSADPVSVLWHYLCGHMVNWANGVDGPTRWTAGSHRGVQWLDKVQFPRKQKRYIFSPQFQVRHDTAFEETVRGCADPNRPGGSWVSDNLVRALTELHRMGFAHSYEAWHEGKLVGGAFGIQLGSMISCDSMFHRMSNASKAAYGQTLVHLQTRGFKIVDTNGVAAHQVNYGEEWMPQWQYQNLVLQCLHDSPSFTDARPCPSLPWEIRAMIPALRAGRALARRLPWSRKPQDPSPPTAPSAATAPDGSGAPSDTPDSPTHFQGNRV